LTTKILTALKQQVRELKLIPGKGGCFELTVNGELLYSKLKTGQFPDEGWVVESLQTRTTKK